MFNVTLVPWCWWNLLKQLFSGVKQSAHLHFWHCTFGKLLNPGYFAPSFLITPDMPVTCIIFSNWGLRYRLSSSTSMWAMLPTGNIHVSLHKMSLNLSHRKESVKNESWEFHITTLIFSTFLRVSWNNWPSLGKYTGRRVFWLFLIHLLVNFWNYMQWHGFADF